MDGCKDEQGDKPEPNDDVDFAIDDIDGQDTSTFCSIHSTPGTMSGSSATIYQL